VISAATGLASQLASAQAAPASTPGANRPAAQAQQISQARQAVSAALESLEADLSGPLLNVAVAQATDYANGFVGSLRDDMPLAVGDAASLRLSYGALHLVAQAIRAQADATDKSGEHAYSGNANRDLRDQSGDVGDPAGDGGSWQSVVRLVEQALGDAASVLFTITSQAVTHYQRGTASALDKFADEVRAADDSQRSRHPGYASTRSSELTFKIQELAGARAARELRQHKTTVAQFLAQLREHDYDPGWQTGAMRELGRTGLAGLLSQVPGVGEPRDQDMRALAMAVAAAMAHGVTFPTLPDSPLYQPYDLTVIAPLLKDGDFSPQALASLGAEALIPVGNSPAAVNAVWAALAANPSAAALFVEQNAPQLTEVISATNPFGAHAEDVAPLLAVIRAGTLGLKGTNPSRAANAVSALVQAYYNDQNARAPGQFSALYGEIIKTYWRDLNYAVTNPSTLAGKSPDGLELTKEQWAPFVDEAMRNPNTAAMIVALGHAQAYQYFKMQGRQPVIPNNPYEYARDAGTVDGYFDYQVLTVYQQLNSEQASSWKATLVNDLALAAIWASPGPEVSIPASLGADVVLPMVDQLLDTPHGTLRPPAPDLNGMYEEIAVAYYDEATSGGTASNPTLQAVLKNAAAVNNAAGQPEPADNDGKTPPAAAPFLVDGKIPSLSSKNANLGPQQAAFINWLNSIANQIEPVVGAAQTAYLSAAAPESQPGG
jgi:hypothetical protein